MARFITYFLIILFIFLGLPAGEAQDREEIALPLLQEIQTLQKDILKPDQASPVRLQQALKAGLLENFDIQSAEQNWKRALAEETRARGRYDTLLASSYTLEDDRSEQPSIVFGNQVKNRVWDAGISKRLPTGTTLGVSYRMDYERTNSPFASIVPVYDGMSTLEARQSLLKNFLGVLDRAEVDIARLTGLIAGEDREEVIEEAVLRIRAAYWDLAASVENLASVEKILDISRELLEIGRRKFSLGTLEKADFLDLMSQTRRRIRELLIAEKEVHLKSSALAFLLGMESADLLYPADPMAVRKRGRSVRGELETAHERRALLRKAELDLERAGLAVRRAENSNLPELDAFAQYHFNGLDSDLSPSVAESFQNEYRSFFVGLEFSVPLENRDARGEARQAAADREKAKVGYKRALAQVYREVIDAHVELLSRTAQMDQAKQIVDLEEQKYREEERQFRIGRSSSERLTRFQDDWIRARILETEARRLVLLSQDQLSRASGTLLDDAALSAPAGS